MSASPVGYIRGAMNHLLGMDKQNVQRKGNLWLDDHQFIGQAAFDDRSLGGVHTLPAFRVRISGVMVFECGAV